jgi:hypothetical protein
MAPAHRGKARRKDVRQEQDLLVTEALRHLDRADIGLGDMQVFGLASG